MVVLIKKVRLIAPGNPLHNQVKDLLIQDGIIRGIRDQISDPADRVIEGENLHISAGWVDVFAHFCDPGFEYKEDLASGSQAAAAGGFTEVMVLPNTSPPVQSKSQVEYIRQKTRGGPVTVYPIGAISRDLAGASLAEMYEMNLSGALAFSDGLIPVQSSGLLLKALQYVKAFDGILIQIPEDTGISKTGLMHEGIYSTRLGMPGKPAIAEEIFIRRDLELARYADSRIHFTGISCQGSLDLIARARSEGVRVSCSVTPYHLAFTDKELQSYDALYKVNPPLRSEEDRQALIRGIEDRTIDCIATHHLPQNPEHKKLEFEYALDGMTGLETCFGLLLQALGPSRLDRIIEMLTLGPRRLFSLEEALIQEGAPANLTLFDPMKEWEYKEPDIRSKSKNTPLLGSRLKGRPLGIIHKNQLLLNNLTP